MHSVDNAIINNLEMRYNAASACLYLIKMRNVLKFRSETGIVYGIKFVLQNKTSQPLPNKKKKIINLDFFVSIVHFPCSFQTIQKINVDILSTTNQFHQHKV